ncbi:helix-turn-helix domain-containing protein [Mycolicibacterium phocaicum]|nr:helix-turn-helix domain-containing protein [Mycolicibacterium sp.]RUP26712.1 MAG: DNA-binding protein [Mycolicibacterium sp.]UCZ63609.1 helix-turn-helix domain-containing protein [Mycolicibacterium phocaicum]
MAERVVSADEELLLTREVEQLTRVPAGTLRYYRAMDRGPRSFRAGRRIVYRRSDVDRWMAEQEQRSGRGEE